MTKLQFWRAGIKENLSDLLSEQAHLNFQFQMFFRRVMDIPRCVQNFRDFANAALFKLTPSTLLEQPTGKFLNYVKYDPVGVAGLISPWNLPLYLVSHQDFQKLVGCLIFSCLSNWHQHLLLGTLLFASQVRWPVSLPGFWCMRSSWQGSHPELLTWWLEKENLPVNVLSTIRMFIFWVSLVVLWSERRSRKMVPSWTRRYLWKWAERILVLYMQTIANRISPQLQGDETKRMTNQKRCFLVFRSSFLNQGEICLCTSRLFVQRPIFDEFVKSYVEEAKKVIAQITDEHHSTSFQFVVGDPSTAVQLGAMNSKVHFEKVKSYIEIAKQDGGHIHCGGVVTVPNGCENVSLNGKSLCFDAEWSFQGYFIAPTVITGLPDTSRVMTDEIFGPVVCVTPFDTSEVSDTTLLEHHIKITQEVIERANSTSYGLSATVWSANTDELLNTANELRAGTVWCNTWLVKLETWQNRN